MKIFLIIVLTIICIWSVFYNVRHRGKLFAFFTFSLSWSIGILFYQIDMTITGDPKAFFIELDPSYNIITISTILGWAIVVNALITVGAKFVYSRLEKYRQGN